MRKGTPLEPAATRPAAAGEPKIEAAPRPTGFDITAAPRAILRESIRLIYSVLGEERLGTAQANAWASVCADRERARNRAEITRLLAQTRADSRP